MAKLLTRSGAPVKDSENAIKKILEIPKNVDKIYHKRTRSGLSSPSQTKRIENKFYLQNQNPEVPNFATLPNFNNSAFEDSLMYDQSKTGEDQQKQQNDS